MTNSELISLVDMLRTLPHETEWVEFKLNNDAPEEIGEYISALSNSACLHGNDAGYLVWGIEDSSHAIMGTTFKPKQARVGNEELENWLSHHLNPRIDFYFHECICAGREVVVLQIYPTRHAPVKFRGESYIRIGSYKKKLKDFPEKERKIWILGEKADWSAGICADASINDLDSDAIALARQKYKQKHPKFAVECDAWDDTVFLNKAKITIQGKITRSAILLLGKDESEHFISPSVAKISWILKNDKNVEQDYEHFGPPFLIQVDAIYSKIRNLKYRYLLDNTLFPTEVTKYEPYVIRESLNNCIAHQDYELNGRIIVVEFPDEILFTNLGTFIPGTVANVIEQDSPQEYYRNPFLANAMVNLNMIDTQGGGIKHMFSLQMERYFPLPGYDLTDKDKVKVRITGKVIDENYTRLLMKHTDLDIKTVILLDKIQKKERISRDDASRLKKGKLIEGRFPSVYVSDRIAATTGSKADYIKNRSFDDSHFKQMVVDYIKKFGTASRKEIDQLLVDKLSNVLTDVQKRHKIRNLLHTMSIKDNLIYNESAGRKSIWKVRN